MGRFFLMNYIKPSPWYKYRVEIKRYLLLLLIPVFLLILLYINVNQVISSQVGEYAELVVDHFHVQSSAMLREMQLVSSSILLDHDVVKVLESDDADALNSLYVCDVIRDSLEESPYVQHAYLISQKTKHIYSDQGLFSSQSLPTILKRIGADDSELFDNSSQADFHVLNENRMAPYCTVPVINADGTSVGTLIVSLRMTEFLRIFYSLDAELCTIFNEDVYISSYIKNIGIDNFDWYDEASVSALVGKPVTCVYQEQGDYTYLVAVSRENYNRPLYVILKWFFIYAIAALVIGYLYLYHVSKQRYQHISSMIQALPVSYQGDQSYEQVYENIRKSLEEYRTQREHLQIENQEYTLHTLLTAEGRQELTPEQFRNAGIDLDRKVYYIAAFFVTEISDPALTNGRTRSTAEFLHILFRSTIVELADQAQVPYAFCDDRKASIAVLFGDDVASLRENVLQISKNAIEILTSSYNISIQATISNPVSSVLNLPDAYQETQRLRDFAKSINSNAATISQEDLQHSSGVLLNGDFIRQEQILINTILARKYDAVPSMVESILSTHVSPLRRNYALAQGRLLSISNVLVEGVRMSSIPSVSIEENARAISQADSVRQLVAITEQVYSFMAEQYRENTSETDIVEIACNYIAQNLSDRNLNVTVICEAAGVSVQRLTRMFQSRFNMAIAEYMNACRINLAKELLPDKQLTISQIAQQVGYSNTDTFTRNFRKIEGITPSEYRKLIQKG